jgi:hypothetical protein
MPDVLAIIQHGTLPDTASLVDEVNLLVQSLTVTPAREMKEYKGASNRAVQGISATNPTIEFDFDCFVGIRAGLAIQHPGTVVTELANFAAARHGFDPDQGTMLYMDPVDEFSNDDPDKIKFKVKQFPFVL